MSEKKTTDFLSELSNKYSGNVEQKNLNEIYDIGLMIANKKFNQDKMIEKVSSIINKKAHSEISDIFISRKNQLIEALNNGIRDGKSDEYRLAYNSSNKYQYDKKSLTIRGRIDGVLNKHDKSD